MLIAALVFGSFDLGVVFCLASGGVALNLDPGCLHFGP